MVFEYEYGDSDYEYDDDKPTESFKGLLKAETVEAILVMRDDLVDVWIPKSQIAADYDLEIGATIEGHMSEWAYINIWE